jgi:hypothetical protein
MIYFVYPTDITTEFLLEIPTRIKNKYGLDAVQVIKVIPSDESYKSSLVEIENIPDNSIIVFMGHGQSDKLWGAENESFPKKPLIRQSDAKIFNNKYLFLLACNSNEFLRGCYLYSKIKSSIGFGSLPTDIEEIASSKRLKELEIDNEVIKLNKQILIELVSKSFCDMIDENLTFTDFYFRLTLRIQKKISSLLLTDKKNSNNRKLADLLFFMKNEMVSI